MVTPVSFPAQQTVSPAQGNLPPHRETAFVFNFNSPAISHDEPGVNNDGPVGNFGPAEDVFQKKNDVPAATLSQPQFSAPAYEPQTPASSEALSMPVPPAQPTFGNAMPTMGPMSGFPGMGGMPMMFPNPMQPPGMASGMFPNTLPPKLPMPPLGTMPFAPKPFTPPVQAQPGFSPAMQQPAFNPGFPQTPPQTQQPQQTQPAALPNMPQPQNLPQDQAPQATAPESAEQPQTPAEPAASAYPEMENDNKTPISDLNTMIAQPRTPDEKLAAINEIATRQQGDRQTYELLKQEISTPMQGIPPETASAIRQAALIALGSLNGNPINAKLPGNELYGMEGIDIILSDKNENPLIKASAVAALGYMNRPQDKTIQKLLKKAAKDSNPDVKNAVAQVQLGQMASPSVGAAKA